MLVPVGAAEWGGRGFYEPDTAQDVLSGMMYDDADTDPGTDAVYFSAYISYSLIGGNPNVAGSNFVPFPTRFHAFLGVWQDCNNDGYIGTHEGALLEYRSDLLLNPGLCPVASSPHNDGQWVQEFLWIGPDHPALCQDGQSLLTNEENDTNPYNIHDGCARVWGDIGLPTDGGQVTCPVTPLPRGTLQSTGGALRYVDCITNYWIYDATVAADDAVPEETLGIQLGFGDADKENPQNSGSILNQDNPYGDPSAEPTVSVFDCTGGETSVSDPTGGSARRVGVSDPTGTVPASVDDPTGVIGDDEDKIDLTNDDGTIIAVNGTDNDGNVVTLHAVRAPTVDSAGSPAGAVNDTLEGTPNIGGGQVESQFVTASPYRAEVNGVEDIDAGDDADCDRDQGTGEHSDVYEIFEADFEPSAPLRTDTDFYFTFYEDTRGAERGSPEGNAIAQALGPATPTDLGLGLNREWTGYPFWWSNPGMLASRNGFVSLDDGSPKGAQHFSFYAFVSPTANDVDLKAGTGTAIYGADHCDGITSITGAWECDPDGWWRDAKGNDISTDWQVKVGQEYNLIDIDCYDETYVRGQAMTTTKLLTGESCARPTP